MLALDEVQPGRTICRIRASSAAQCTDYESRVLAELTSKAVDGIVPADALTTGPELQSKRWHRALESEVVADAQARGLTVARWPRRVCVALGFGLGIIGVLLAVSAEVSGEAASDDATLLGAIAAAVAVVTIVAGGAAVARLTGSLAQLPTASGRVRGTTCRGARVHAARQRGPRRSPARGREAVGPPLRLRRGVRRRAARGGAAPDGRGGRSPGVEPLRRPLAHRADPVPPRVPTAWGKHPVLAVALALLWAGVAGLVGYGLAEVRGASRPTEISASTWEWVDRGTAIAFVPVALVAAWCLWVLVRAIPDVWQTRTVVGDIVRDRRFRQWFSSGENPEYWYYLAVDDGTADRIPAWRVRQVLWTERSQGESVRAEVSPRLGYVRSIGTA